MKKSSSIFIFVALSLALAGGCGQQAPSGQGSGGAEATGGGETTGGTTGETTAAEAFRAEEGALVIYSGREEGLVGPVIEQFEEETGIDAQVRYGDTAELASTIAEEGENSPADVFFAQDPGALGAIADAGAFEELPEETLSRVPEEYRSPDNLWVGTCGRARVVAYNTEALQEDELPASIFDFTEPEWKGRIGWAPTNASFQAFVTALMVTAGEDRAREWLEGIQANEPVVYPDNSTTLDAVASGEVEVGFVNHYYLYRALAEQGEDFGARNHFFPGEDPGALVLVAGAGILKTADNPDEAQRFVDYLLAEEAQQYFADETYEYPMVEGIQTPEGLVPLAEIDHPDVDLGDLDDLQGTLELLRDTGVL